MNQLITGMEEARAKFAKACDADSLKEIKAALMRGSCPLGEEILDKITQFHTGNTKASFKNDGNDLFRDDTTFQMGIKKTNAASHEKEWIRSVADSVNMDAEKKKGKILAGISNPEQAKDLVPFIPYFKVLFKLCQVGMTQKSRQSKQRREEEATKTLKDLEVNCETQEALIENLNFRKLIDGEVERAQQTELRALEEKRQRLTD